MGKGLKTFLVGAVLIGASFIPGLPALASTILLSSGIGLSSRAVFRPASIAERINSMQQQIASNVAELPVCYGLNRIGFRLADVRVKASDPRKLMVVGAFCHGPDLGGGIEAIGEIFIEDRLAVDVDGDVMPAFVASGSDRITYIGKHLGTNSQAADTELVASYSDGWTAAHRGRGVAYLALEHRFDANIFSSLPEISAYVYGTKVYDLRDHTVKYSTNPMLCLWDYLMSERYGWALGRLLVIASSQVTASGMGSFSAANAVNEVHNDVAWHTNSASSGAYVRTDFGVPVELARCALWVLFDQRASGTGVAPNPGTTNQNNGIYDIEYSDDGSSWSTAIAGFRPVLPLRNAIHWGNRGAHRYWQLKLTNTPGAGAAIAGLEWYESELDDAATIEEANYCDDEVPQPADDSAYQTVTSATTATPIVVTKAGHGLLDGDVINVRATGLTPPGLNLLGEWTVDVLTSSTFRLVGSVGVGTYVGGASFAPLVNRKRFDCAGVVDTALQPEENARQLLSCCRGNLVWEGGKYRPFIRKPQTSSFALTADDIVGPIRVVLPSTLEQKNTGRGTFIDPDRNFQPDSVVWPPPIDLNSYLAIDGGFASDGDFEMPFTQNRYTAEQIIMVGVKESRAAKLVQFEMPEHGLLLRTGAKGTFSHDSFGWTDKEFTVEALALDPQTGRVQVTLKEYDELAYELDPHDQTLTPPDSNFPDALAVPDALTGLVLTSSDSEYIAVENGNYLQRIRVQWDASDNPFADYVEVRAKHEGQPEFTVVGTAEPEGEFLLSPVVAEVEWTVEVRLVTTLGKRSAWTTGLITPSTYTRPLPVGVTDFFDDFPGSPARWDVTLGGATAIVEGGNAQLGGRVLQARDVVQAIWTSFIPFDRRALYSMRLRIRKVQNSSDGPTYVDIGFACYNSEQEPIAPNLGGVAGESILAVAMNQVDPPLGLDFVEYRGFAQGWNGQWYQPAAGTLTNSGLGNYTGANVGDGNPSSKAFDTDSASAGAYLRLDPGDTRFFSRIRLYLSAASATAQWKVQHSPDGSTWHDVVFRGGGSTWTPNKAGWNEIDWEILGIGTLTRYWRLYLNNSPGAGPDVHDVGWLWTENPGYVPPANPAFFGTPVKFPPGTAYVKPGMFFFGGGATPGIFEVDMVELPPAAGATILL
jgi:hypothetical protein